MESLGYLIIAVVATGVAVLGNKYFSLSPRVGFALFTVALVAFITYIYKLIKNSK